MLEKIKDSISEFLSREGFELVDLFFKKKGRRPVLAILAERAEREKGGITLDECIQLNRKIEELLERNDLIMERYLLEVSSPGINRPLRTEADFRRSRGQRVEITTSDNRFYIGRIKEVSPDSVIIERKGGGDLCLRRQNIARAKLKVEL